jgi:pimeloyl-ACP methyl ester carboxylesterase/acyl carrier protein
MHPVTTSEIITIQSLHHASQEDDDEAFFAKATGELWTAGVTIDWSRFYPQSTPVRIPLPAYPFERKRYWIESTYSGIPPVNSQEPSTCQTDTLCNLENQDTVPANVRIEHFLIDLWKKLLGLETLAITDDFFEIGGNSVLSVEIFNEIHKKFKVRLSIAVLLEHKNVQALSEYLAHLVVIPEAVKPYNTRQKAVQQPNKKASGWSTVVSIRTTGNLPPFFCVSGLGGNPMELHYLANALGMDQPFYLLQHRGVDGTLRPHGTIEEMAMEFVKDIRQIQPEGPYFVGGYSFGGVAAYEMVQLLQKQSAKTAGLILLDTANPQVVKWTLMEYIGAHLANIKKKGFGYIVDRSIAFSTSRVRRKLANTVKKDSFALRNDLVTDYNIKASLSYKPSSIDTNVLLIQCTQT